MPAWCVRATRGTEPILFTLLTKCEFFRTFRLVFPRQAGYVDNEG